MPLGIFFKNLQQFFNKPLTTSPSHSGLDVGEIPYPPDSYESTAWRYYEKMLEIETERTKIYSQVENCITGDTKISLLDGRDVCIKDLSTDKYFWVYSCTPRGKVVPGKAISLGVKRRNAELVEVTLDNNEKIKCTPDHKFMMRDGTYKEAKDLKSGDSLMPLYRGLVPYNHTVASVKSLDQREDVYDITVEKYHNFALTAGVLISNCDDESDLLTAVMDTYAEETTQRDPDIARTIWVESKNPVVKDHITRLFDRLDVEDKIYGIARSIVKYGDLFMKLYLKPQYGIESWVMFSPYHCVRLEKEGILKGFYLGTELPGDPKNLEPNHLPWELVHWRLMGKAVDLLYGTSAIASGMRIYRKLMMMEDHLVIYRVLRAPDRFVHYLDCGDVSPDVAQRMAQKYASQLKKDRMLDATTSPIEGVKEAYKPPAAVDDIVFPLTKNKQSKIEKLAGSNNFSDVYDIEYMLKRLLSCLRVPPGYLGIEKEGGLFDSKNALVQQDVRFARQCKKLQRAIIIGFVRLGQIELMYNNLDARDPQNEFTVSMPPISYLEEAQRNAVIQTRVDIMGKLADLGVTLKLNRVAWLTYILRTFGRFTDDIIRQYLSGMPGEALGAAEPTPEEKEAIDRVVAKQGVKAILDSIGELHSMRGPTSVRSLDVPSVSEPLPEQQKPGTAFREGGA